MNTANVSQHPLFKWAVALWFALLLGGGYFVLPDAVHANIIDKLGLTDVLPTGSLGKVLLTAAAALLGLLVGLAIASRVATLNRDMMEDSDQDIAPEIARLNYDGPSEPETLAEEDSPRRPFNPRQDIGEEGIGYNATLEPGDDDGDALTQLWREETMGNDGRLDTPEPHENTVETEPLHDGENDFEEISEDAGAAASAYNVETELVEPIDREDTDDEIYDEFEELPDEAEPDLAEASTSTAHASEDALGDLSLEALTERLAQAITAAMREVETGQTAEADASDPVVTFLHRKEDRAGLEHSEPGEEDDPQTVLKSALDRLSKVGRQT